MTSNLDARLAKSSDQKEGGMRVLNDDDRRQYPRIPVDLPLDYRVPDQSRTHAGLVVNASETGLLMHSIQDLPLGSMLNIAILFLNEYELTEVKVRAEIVWKDAHRKNDWKGYEYGLRFDPLEGKDRSKLKQLLGCAFQKSEMPWPDRRVEPLAAYHA